MRRVKIILPATIAELGPGLNGLALALSLHTIIEVTERSDDRLIVETAGEDAGRYAVGLRHPVVIGLIRVFQRLERSVLGLTVRVDNRIPHAAGLGVETAFVTAGIIAANNLLGTPYKREEVLLTAAEETQRPEQAAACVLGGLVSAVVTEQGLLHRSLPVGALQVVIVTPEAADYGQAARGRIPEQVPLKDALFNLGRLPLLLDALRESNLSLLGRVVEDRLYAPFTRDLIPGAERATQEALKVGASAVMRTQNGALVAFTDKHHQPVAEAMRDALSAAGVASRAWTLPIDRQGLVVSVMQSA